MTLMFRYRNVLNGLTIAMIHWEHGSRFAPYDQD